MVFGISGGEEVRVRYHGHNEIEVEVGDLLRFQTIAGRWRVGLFLGMEVFGWPRNIAYVRVLTESGPKKINSNMIFRMEGL